MMVSPNYAYQIYDVDGSAYGKTGPPSSAEAEHDLARFFTEEAHESFTQIELDGQSNYGQFLAAGVATGGIECGAEGIKTEEEAAMFGGVAGIEYDVSYGTAGDNVQDLNMDSWIVMSKASAHMTATYARRFDSLPPKTEAAKIKRKEVVKRLGERLRVH
jgi:hypothetical protein